MRAIAVGCLLMLVGAGCHFSPSGTEGDGGTPNTTSDAAPFFDGGNGGDLGGRSLHGKVETLGPHEATANRRLVWAGLDETEACSKTRCLRGAILP